MKTHSLDPLFIALSRLVIIPLLLCPVVSRAQEANIAGLNISMVLLNQDGSPVRTLTGEDVTLTVQKFIFRKGDNIRALLTGNGIKADGEAMAIVYRLNPALDALSVQPGKEIVLPTIKDGQQLLRGANKGYLIALWLDKELKQDFLRELKELTATAAGISGLKVQQFESANAKDEFVKTTNSIVEKMEAFRDAIMYRTRPLSSEMIQQMSIEAKQVGFILKNMTKAEQQLTKLDMETVDLIAQDMGIRMQTLEEEKGEGGLSLNPEVLVKVKILDPTSGMEIHLLEVYAVARAFWNSYDKDQKRFPHPTPKAERRLPVGNYFIWAISPKDSKQVSDPTPWEVRRTGEGDTPNTVTLFIKQRGNP